MRIAPTLTAAALILTGCASQVSNAPSLLPRAIESRSDAEPVVTAGPIVADPALDAELARRVADFDAAARAYDAVVPAIERQLARSTTAREGTDAWLAGQAAIGELGQARSAIDTAFAQIEQLAITRGAAGEPPYPALDAALVAAQARFEASAATDARLRAMLPN